MPLAKKVPPDVMSVRVFVPPSGINLVYRNRTMVALAEGYFATGDPGKPVLHIWPA